MKISATQLEALHHLATLRPGQPPRVSSTPTAKALIAKGLVEPVNQRAGHAVSRWTDYTLTDAGRAAHDEVYTPERLADEQRIRRAQQEQAAAAIATRNEALEAEAQARTAAGIRLAELLGDTPVPYPLSSLLGQEPVRVHADKSGVWGGSTLSTPVTSVHLLAFVEAVLANQENR